MTGIYFLIKDNKVVYVGQTTDWPFRLKYHVSQALDFDHAKFIECPNNRLQAMEKAYIEKYKPIHNHAHNCKKPLSGKPKLYAFRVGSQKWKQATNRMVFRKLTLKSFIGFGQFKDTTVSRMFDLGKVYDLMNIYFLCSHITFVDEILDKLLIGPEWRIEKPGVDKEKFYEFCATVHPALVSMKKERYANLTRKRSRQILKEERVLVRHKQTLLMQNRKDFR